MSGSSVFETRRQSEASGFAAPLKTLGEMAPELLRPPESRRARRRARQFRFVLCEAAALTVFFVCGVLGKSSRFLAPSWNHIFTLLFVLSASAVALIPVLFYGALNKPSARLR